MTRILIVSRDIGNGDFLSQATLEALMLTLKRQGSVIYHITPKHGIDLPIANVTTTERGIEADVPDRRPTP